MKKTLFAMASLLALATAAPASAAVVGTACSTSVPDPDAVACLQVDGNILNQNSSNDFNSLVDQLLTLSGTGLTLGDLQYKTPGYGDTKTSFSISNGDILNFGTTLVGYNIIGVHFGSSGGNSGTGQQTLLYLFNFAAPGATSIDLNRTGFSDAVRVSVPSAVPEPATWALMLMGFGGMGMAMRRRRTTNHLNQMA